MYLIERFEKFKKPEKPKKDEFIIFKNDDNGDLFLVEITSYSRQEGGTSRSFIHNDMKILDDGVKNDNNGSTLDLYYNIQHLFFTIISSVLSVLWRGMDKEEATEQYKLLSDINKYNI